MGRDWGRDGFAWGVTGGVTGGVQEGDVRELCGDPEVYVTEELNEEGLRVR